MTDTATAERDFLVRRMTDRRADVGMSSQSMLLFALGKGPRPRVPGRSTKPGYWQGEECGRDWYPVDRDDLGRCERTYASAPPHLQERMLPVLEEFRGWVLHRINHHGEVEPRA